MLMAAGMHCGSYWRELSSAALPEFASESLEIGAAAGTAFAMRAGRKVLFPSDVLCTLAGRPIPLPCANGDCDAVRPIDAGCGVTFTAQDCPGLKEHDALKARQVCSSAVFDA